MSRRSERLRLNRTVFEMLPGGWQITAEEFDEVIEPCYMYLPEEFIGTSPKEFSNWLIANGITDTEGLRYPWMAVVGEMRKDYCLLQQDKETIERLNEKLAHLSKANKEMQDERRGRFLDLSECTETYLRKMERLQAEKKLLQDEVDSLTAAVKTNKDTISRLENRLQEKETAKEALHRDIEALLEERMQLQDEVLTLAKVVEELSEDISDEEILRMVKESGRAEFFKWYNGRAGRASPYEVPEENPLSRDPRVMVKWIEEIKKVDDAEIHIKDMQHREWIILRPEDEQGVLFLTHHETIMRFDGIRTNGRKLTFFLRGLEIYSMYPIIGWVVRVVKE